MVEKQMCIFISSESKIDNILQYSLLSFTNFFIVLESQHHNYYQLLQQIILYAY